MSDIVKSEEKFDEFELICGDCKGHQQIFNVVENNKPTLFTKKYYQKWLLKCSFCQLQSKIFTTKLKEQNGTPQEQV